MYPFLRICRASSVALLCGLFASAAAAGSVEPREYLDEQTAATVTVVAEPLVFACPRRDLAAHARDYVTLSAAAVNRAGKLSYVLIGYNWSTADPRLRRDPLPAAEALVLRADDRRIELMLRSRSAHEAGIGLPVHPPPGSEAQPNVYGTDLATLRFLSESRNLTLEADTGDSSVGYQLWEDRRAALRRFVQHMNGEP